MEAMFCCFCDEFESIVVSTRRGRFPVRDAGKKEGGQLSKKRTTEFLPSKFSSRLMSWLRFIESTDSQVAGEDRRMTWLPFAKISACPMHGWSSSAHFGSQKVPDFSVLLPRGAILRNIIPFHNEFNHFRDYTLSFHFLPSASEVKSCIDVLVSMA